MFIYYPKNVGDLCWKYATIEFSSFYFPVFTQMCNVFYRCNMKVNVWMIWPCIIAPHKSINIILQVCFITTKKSLLATVIIIITLCEAWATWYLHVNFLLAFVAAAAMVGSSFSLLFCLSALCPFNSTAPASCHRTHWIVGNSLAKVGIDADFGKGCIKGRGWALTDLPFSIGSALKPFLCSHERAPKGVSQ